jgi:maleate cis-trans isomerase
MIDLIPRHQLGYVLPIPVGDYVHYQFYRACPADCFLVARPLDLKAFTPEGVDAALAAFHPAVDFLIDRRVHRISQGGIPISALAGRARILEMLDSIRRRTDIPATADFEETIEAFQALGITRVAVAAKWDDRLMRGVGDYLAEAGIQAVGFTAEAHSAAEVMAVTPQEGVDLALALGRKALSDHPDAEGLLLAGGAWLSLQVIPTLEQEFGKPVVTNPTATVWAALRQFGRPTAQPGFGRLLDSLRQPASDR